MLKKVVASGLALTMAIGLAGCGSSSSSGKSASTSSNGKQVLTVSYPNWWQNWFQGLKKDFEAQNKNVEVKLVPLEGDTTTKQAMMMKSKQTSPDVSVEDTFIINSDVNAGYLSPMDKVVNNWGDWSKFATTVKQGVTAAKDGKVYGVPFSTDVEGLWYDKKLFKEAGLPVPFEPKSWDDVLNAAKTIKSKAPTDVIPLFTYVTKATGEATSMRTFQVLYSGTGSNLYDFNQKKWIVDEKALTDTFNYVDTVFKNKLGPSLSVASNSQVATLLSDNLMQNNKVAMVMDGNWVAASWRQGRNKPWPNALDTWGFIPFPTQNGQGPKFTSMSGGWALSIPTNAKNADLAAKFIKMAVDEEHQFNYVKQSGDMTVRTDVASKPDYLNQPVSNYREAGDILKYTHFRPAVDNYPAISTQIQEVVESVATGSATPKQAVQNYETGLERIVGAKNIIKK